MSALIVRGDARRLPLPDASVDLIVTSPPYWALRSYTDGGQHYDGQIGAEPIPGEYVDALLKCTREWMRVLKPTGSIFVNLSDTYRGKSLLMLPERYRIGCVDTLGLTARAVVIWAKNGLPESVTDRVRRTHEEWVHLTKGPFYYSAIDEIRAPHDAPTRRAGANAFGGRNAHHRRTGTGAYTGPNPTGAVPGSVWEIGTQPLRVPDHLAVDHHASFPLEWPRRLILGWSPPGICTGCGAGRRPEAAETGLDPARPQARRAAALAQQHQLTDEHIAAVRAVGVSDTGRGAATQTGTGHNTDRVMQLAAEARAVLGGYAREFLLQRPTRLRYVCACSEPSAPTRAAVVLDPFGGTGTTALVALALGRRGVTVDRSADYCRIAAWRTADAGERARALGLPKPEPVLEGQEALFASVTS